MHSFPIDNSATLDFKLLNEFIKSGSSFMMEVTRRTDVDRKGGHLAKSKKNGNLLLREIAQCQVILRSFKIYLSIDFLILTTFDCLDRLEN